MRSLLRQGTAESALKPSPPALIFAMKAPAALTGSICKRLYSGRCGNRYYSRLYPACFSLPELNKSDLPAWDDSLNHLGEAAIHSQALVTVT
jgi:hypothetical protein